MKRRIMGSAIWIARLIGASLILLATLSFVQMRFLAGSATGKLGMATAITLGLVGIAWLIAVQVFVHFFDQFLSRN
jgi:hypothetical protein